MAWLWCTVRSDFFNMSSLPTHLFLLAAIHNVRIINNIGEVFGLCSIHTKLGHLLFTLLTKILHSVTLEKFGSSLVGSYTSVLTSPVVCLPRVHCLCTCHCHYVINKYIYIEIITQWDTYQRENNISMKTRLNALERLRWVALKCCWMRCEQGNCKDWVGGYYKSIVSV